MKATAKCALIVSIFITSLFTNDLYANDECIENISKVINSKGVHKTLNISKTAPIKEQSKAFSIRVITSLVSDKFHKKFKSLYQDIIQNLDFKNEKNDFWEAAITIGNHINNNKLIKTSKKQLIGLIEIIRNYKGAISRVSKKITTVVFGTSGWRGRIGDDFTHLNVAKVTRGIIEMLKSSEFLKVNGYKSFKEVQEAGIVVLRDNRFLGDEYSDVIIRELVQAGIKVYNLGECPTGVGSALVTKKKAAGSINFTPSHNPMDYQGIKFNPGDGGPADKNLTSIIEKRSNYYMKKNMDFTPAKVSKEKLKQFVKNINAKKAFKSYLEKDSELFDMKKIRNFLNDNAKDLYLVIDNMHGASRGYFEEIIGKETMAKLESFGAIVFKNTNDDYSFHGIKPEPSAANQAYIVDMLKKKKRKFTLGVALDPDGDRIRFSDASMDMDMNKFGALAYAHYLSLGHLGGVASTAPTSDFALEIAKKMGQKFYETAVGFKFFRKHLKNDGALVAFEESDGISFKGHTLEKDGIAAFFCALDTMASSNKNISEQFVDLQKKFGYFYPDKAGVDVKGVSIEKWQAYKKEVVEVLKHELYKVGDSIELNGINKTIVDINTIDGLKVIFNDRSWILLRPSGTEPKFRIYYEVVGADEIHDVDKVLEQYLKAGEKILDKARSVVDNR